MRAWLPLLRVPRPTFWPRLAGRTALRRFMQLLPVFLPVVLLVAEVPLSLRLSLLTVTSCCNSFRICLPLRATMLWPGQWLSHTTASHSNIKADFIP